jgi:hypothetical protein
MAISSPQAIAMGHAGCQRFSRHYDGKGRIRSAERPWQASFEACSRRFLCATGFAAPATFRQIVD